MPSSAQDYALGVFPAKPPEFLAAARKHLEIPTLADGFRRIIRIELMEADASSDGQDATRRRGSNHDFIHAMIALRRWRPRHLLLSWAIYWGALILVTLGPAIKAAVSLMRTPDSHGTAAMSVDNGTIAVSIAERGHSSWSGSVGLLSLVLLLAGPPLLIWTLWLFSASRTNNAEPLLTNHPRAREIHAAEPRNGIVDTSNSKYPQREEL